jgi:hypothetical protein
MFLAFLLVQLFFEEVGEKLVSLVQILRSFPFVQRMILCGKWKMLIFSYHKSYQQASYTCYDCDL